MTFKNRDLVLTGAIAFMLFCILQMPAAVVLGLMGAMGDVRYSRADGTAWHMRLENAVWRGLPLGQVDLVPHIGALLTGTVAADVHLQGQKLQGTMAVRLDDGIEISDFTLMADMDARFGTQSLMGPVSVTGDRLVFDSAGQCVAGSARLRTDILGSALQVPGFDVPVLAGQAICENGAVQVTVAGNNAVVQVSGQGTWHKGAPVAADVLVVFSNPAALPDDMNLALEFMGLHATNDGWRGQLTLDIF